MSSADERSVTTDALETLGTIITEAEKRDAIHLAVENVVAAEELNPGDHVGLVQGGKAGTCDSPVGIVDPFLIRPVLPGERFWLVVYPRKITSLRHVWTHPAFDGPGDDQAPRCSKEESEAWLRAFVARSDCPDYETVVAVATGYGHQWDDEYLYFSGRDAHGEIPPEFWDHVENVTGRKGLSRAKWFSCAC